MVRVMSLFYHWLYPQARWGAVESGTFHDGKHLPELDILSRATADRAPLRRTSVELIASDVDTRKHVSV